MPIVKKYLLPEQQILGEQIMQEWSEPETQRIITDWADYVALTVYNLAVTMNPEKILIGGGISTEPRLIPLILKALRKIPIGQIFLCLLRRVCIKMIQGY